MAGIFRKMNVVYWFVGYAAAILSSIAFPVMMIDTSGRWSADEVSEAPVSILFAGVLLGGMLLVFHTIMYLVLLALMLRKEGMRMKASDAIVRKEAWSYNAVRLAGYVVMAAFAQQYIRSLLRYEDVVTSELVFYSAALVTTLIYLIGANAWLRTRRNRFGRGERRYR